MAEIQLVDIPTPWGSWRRVCRSKLSPDCKRVFTTRADWHACGPCEEAQKRLDAAAREARLDRTALTPDFDRETGFLSIMTIEERWRHRWGVPKWV